MHAALAATFSRVHATHSRSSVHAWQRRPLESSDLWACFNEEHKRLKRPPPAAPSEAPPVVRPFNPAGFHFNKAPPTEIIAHFFRDTGALACASENESAPPPATTSSPLWLNVSPIWPGHCLFTPRVEEGHPQVATPLLFGDVAMLVAAMGRAEDAEALSAVSAAWCPERPAGGGFFAGFNSLGAHASVNHFHVHTGWSPALCYTDAGGGTSGGGAGWLPGAGLPCQRAPLAPLGAGDGGLRLYRVAWHVPGFLLAWEDGEGGGAAALGRAAGALCAWLAGRNVPHNVVFARVPAAAEGGGGAPPPGALTILVFPRTHQRESFGGGMGVALAEIAGLAICTEPETWAGMCAASFSAELSAVGLPRAEFDALEAAVIANALPAAAIASRPPFLSAATQEEVDARATVWSELVWALPFGVGRDISTRVRDDARGGAVEDAVGLPPNDTVRPPPPPTPSPLPLPHMLFFATTPPPPPPTPQPPQRTLPTAKRPLRPLRAPFLL
jgi:hypothetical protein